MKWLGSALAGALLAAAAAADQADPRLEDLFRDLKSAPDAARALQTEARIWRVWMQSGEPEIDTLMRRGVGALGEGRLDAAGRAFQAVVERAPGLAEGWNKRATVRYLQGDLEGSVRDIRRTLALEPRHFGALSGMGLIFLRRGDDTGALSAFEAVLGIHPWSPGARLQVERLRERRPGVDARAGRRSTIERNRGEATWTSPARASPTAGA